MSGSTEVAGFLDPFRARGAAIADACTRCGDCFRACPMTGPAGIGDADPSATAAAIVDLITGGAGNAEAARWSEACSGSGYCIPACKHGINPRFMVQLARGFARRNTGTTPLPTRWRQGFQSMSRGVRVLSRLQLPPEILARFAPSREPRDGPPDVVFYTGCNVLKTPHIALLCLDILDLLGIDYEVMGGVGQCCGVYQFREGDFATNNKVAYATIDGLASAGASTVLSWCPSCQGSGPRPPASRSSPPISATWCSANSPPSPRPGSRRWRRSTTPATGRFATPATGGALRWSILWKSSARGSVSPARTSTSGS